MQYKYRRICYGKGLTHRVVVAVESEGLTHSEVAYLSERLANQQHVASRQVAMNEVVALQVGHSIGDLAHQLYHFRHRHVPVAFKTDRITAVKGGRGREGEGEEGGREGEGGRGGREGGQEGGREGGRKGGNHYLAKYT